MSTTNPRAYRNALKGGKRQFRHREWKQAAEYFESALAKNPTSVAAWEWLAKARLEESPEAAWTVCQRWAQSGIGKESAAKWAGVAWERKVLEQLEEGLDAALAICRRWVATGMATELALKWTGIVLERRGHIDAAKDAYATAELLRRK
jgi:hypothetical protein